jgi:competence protein ComEA
VGPSFTKDEKKLFLFLLVMLALGAVVLPYVDSRRRADIFTARSAAEQMTAGAGAKTGQHGRSASREGQTESRLLDLNLATEAEFVALPGIGPVRAQAIVAWRDNHGPFRSVADLAKVHGIGKATLQALDGYVTVQSSQAQTSATSAALPPAPIGFTPAPPGGGVQAAQAPQDAAAVATHEPQHVIDLNTASAQELADLDQIGPVLAQRIIEYRRLHGRFLSVDELDRVRGIGKKRIDANRHRLVVR